MLVSVMRGRIEERTRNFGHLVHETCPRNCVWSVYKFYKNQTKSENHETCWDVVISYVEAMIKISENFVHVVTYDAYKPGHLHMWYQIWHVLHSAKNCTSEEIFAECNSLPSVALGKEDLCRVSDFWHSTKNFTLGKVSVSVVYFFWPPLS